MHPCSLDPFSVTATSSCLPQYCPPPAPHPLLTPTPPERVSGVFPLLGFHMGVFTWLCVLPGLCMQRLRVFTQLCMQRCLGLAHSCACCLDCACRGQGFSHHGACLSMQSGTCSHSSRRCVTHPSGSQGSARSCWTSHGAAPTVGLCPSTRSMCTCLTRVGWCPMP